MAGITIQLTGVPQTMARLKGYSRDVISKAQQAGVYNVGNKLIETVIPFTPKLGGTLRRSAFCAVPVVNASRVTGEVGMGGAAKAYAWAQHQGFIEPKSGRSDGKKIVFRNYTEPGTGPKFFDKAAEVLRSRAVGYFTVAFEAVLKRNGGGGLGAMYPTTPPSGGAGRGPRIKKAKPT